MGAAHRTDMRAGQAFRLLMIALSVDTGPRARADAQTEESGSRHEGQRLEHVLWGRTTREKASEAIADRAVTPSVRSSHSRRLG